MASPVDSARVVALSVLVLGAVALQAGHAESQRREALFVYGYLDKVLQITDLIDRATSRRLTQPPPEARAFRFTHWRPVLNSFPTLRDIVEDKDLRQHDDLSRYELPFLLDPTNLCSYRIQQGSSNKEIRASVITRHIPSGSTQSGTGTILLSNAFFVSFDGFCEDRLGRQPPFILISSTVGGPQNWSIVLEESVHRALVGEIPRSSWPGDRDIAVLAVERSALRELILFDAWKAKGELHPATPAGVRNAMKDLVTIQIKDPTLFSLSVPRDGMVFVFPVLYLAMAVVFLHAARRLDPTASADGTWLVLGPRGIIEHTAAILWALATIVAGLAVLFVVHVFALGQLAPARCGVALSSWRHFLGQWPTCLSMFREAPVWAALLGIAGLGLFTHAWLVILRWNRRASKDAFARKFGVGDE